MKFGWIYIIYSAAYVFSVVRSYFVNMGQSYGIWGLNPDFSLGFLYITLILSVSLTWLGYGIIRYKKWAWEVGMLLSIIGVPGSIFFFMVGMVAFGDTSTQPLSGGEAPWFPISFFVISLYTFIALVGNRKLFVSPIYD